MDSRNEGPLMGYLTTTYVDEPDWLQTARAAGDAIHAGMQMSPYEAHLLGWFARLHGANHALEIGTFMGATALRLAMAGAQVTTLEASAKHAALARNHIAASPHADAITVVEADALTWLRAQPHKPQYDVLFLDAEKRHYMDYLDAALPLLAPHALIIADNTLLWGAVTGEKPDAAKPEAVEVMRAFNARLGNLTEFDGVLIPTAEGMTVARRK